jgi:8-oxo-dGTP pyrophosphatase MutT (NUDIX family)
MDNMGNNKRDRASAVIMRGKDILLIRRVKPDKTYYVFPGGGLEDGEDSMKAVIREVKEETSLDAGSPERLFCLEHSENGKNCFFLIKATSGSEPKLGGPELKRMNEDNQYILEWIAVSGLAGLPLYPEEAKIKVIELLCPKKPTKTI